MNLQQHIKKCITGKERRKEKTKKMFYWQKRKDVELINPTEHVYDFAEGCLLRGVLFL